MWNWLTTVQVGGDVVYGEGGPVTTSENADQLVGKAVNGGVLSRVSAKEGTKCRGAIDGNEAPKRYGFSLPSPRNVRPIAREGPSCRENESNEADRLDFGHWQSEDSRRRWHAPASRWSSQMKALAFRSFKPC